MAAVGAAIVFETVLDNVEGQALAVATNLAYPLGDLVLLAVIVGALAGTGWRLDRSWLLLARRRVHVLAGRLAVPGADRGGTYVSGGWFDAGWWAGLFLIAVAAWQPPAGRARVAEGERLRVIAVPLGFGLVGLGLLVYGDTRATSTRSPSALAAASLLAVMARLILTFRENVAMLKASRGEALTDPLTCLGNRRALTRELAEILPEVTEERPLVLALFDLDGFKHYNDTFGHPAGDALLTRLGGNLAACLGGRGTAFRMGGDEFCALFEPGGDDPEALVQSAAAALSEHGEGFTVGCSFGAVTVPDGGGRPHRGAAHRRPAHVRLQARRAHVGRAPEQGRAAARAGRAQPRARRAPQRRRRARRAHGAPARARARGRRAHPPRRRAARRRARWRSPTRSSTSRPRSTTRSGPSSAATR